MANSAPITLNENNDEDILVAVTTNQPVAGTKLDLTGVTVEAFLKTSAATADDDPTTWQGTTDGESPAIVVTDAVNGALTVSVPASAVTTAKHWWRVDVIDSDSKRKTAVFGAVTVTDL